MENIRKQFEDLMTVYGSEKVKVIARELLGAHTRPIPAEHVPVIAAAALEKTLQQLERALTEIQIAGNDKEAAYQDKAYLVTQQALFEATVKLAEAEAFMQIEGEGRDQYVIEDGKKISLNNDSARDAFRRRASSEERRQLANFSAKLSAREVDIAKAGDAWFTAKEAVETIRAKAYLQAALLNFLSGRAG